jgi:hypothetical protein
MTDTELVNFISENGIQVWPQRKSKHAPVLRWWVQNVSPFVQISDGDLRSAVERLRVIVSEYEDAYH